MKISLNISINSSETGTEGNLYNNISVHTSFLNQYKVLDMYRSNRLTFREYIISLLMKYTLVEFILTHSRSSIL